MRLEIGAGEHPDETYDLHVDVLPLPGIDVICRMDRLPFGNATLTSLRANHVLEHQSWELIEYTLREWARGTSRRQHRGAGCPLDCRAVGTRGARYAGGELLALGRSFRS